MLIKIEAIPMRKQQGIQKILLYNGSGENIPANKIQVVSHNADTRKGTSNLTGLFTEVGGDSPPYQEYEQNDLYYLLEVPSNVRLIKLQNWGNTGYSLKGITLSRYSGSTQSSIAFQEEKYFHNNGASTWVEFTGFLTIKSLFKKDNQYGYYTDSFQSLGTSYPTKEQFEQYGMKDLSILEAGDIPVDYEMELISETEEEKCFSYSFDLNGQHKKLTVIESIE